MIIVVATGDDATGLSGQTPTTQSRKGVRTAEVVANNANQLDLPFVWPKDLPQSADIGDATAWLLLVHFTGNAVRAELARPVSFDENLRVSGWYERIILPEVEGEPPGEIFDFGPDESPDIDVPVRRRV